jgi:hypothetical protein
MLGEAAGVGVLRKTGRTVRREAFAGTHGAARWPCPRRGAVERLFIPPPEAAVATPRLGCRRDDAEAADDGPTSFWPDSRVRIRSGASDEPRPQPAAPPPEPPHLAVAGRLGGR